MYIIYVPCVCMCVYVCICLSVCVSEFPLNKKQFIYYPNSKNHNSFNKVQFIIWSVLLTLIFVLSIFHNQNFEKLVKNTQNPVLVPSTCTASKNSAYIYIFICLS